MCRLAAAWLPDLARSTRLGVRCGAVGCCLRCAVLFLCVQFSASALPRRTAFAWLARSDNSVRRRRGRRAAGPPGRSIARKRYISSTAHGRSLQGGPRLRPGSGSDGRRELAPRVRRRGPRRRGAVRVGAVPRWGQRSSARDPAAWDDGAREAMASPRARVAERCVCPRGPRPSTAAELDDPAFMLAGARSRAGDAAADRRRAITSLCGLMGGPPWCMMASPRIQMLGLKGRGVHLYRG